MKNILFKCYENAKENNKNMDFICMIETDNTYMFVLIKKGTDIKKANLMLNTYSTYDKYSGKFIGDLDISDDIVYDSLKDSTNKRIDGSELERYILSNS